jgi:hypothetical protein
LAAWRTIHETAVYSSLLGDHGFADENRLTRRWLGYADVERYTDAKIYQDHVDRLGYEPFTAETMAALQAKAESAVADFGPALKSLNGWARELAERPTFRVLEQLAGLGHLRGHYRWASHRVHADGRGNETNWFSHRDRRARLAAPTNTGDFVDVADLTVGSLHVVTNSVLLNAREGAPHYGEIVAAELLGLMRASITEAFVEGHDIVAEAERLIVEEGVEEPLENLTEWWGRTDER